MTDHLSTAVTSYILVSSSFLMDDLILRRVGDVQYVRVLNFIPASFGMMMIVASTLKMIQHVRSGSAQ